MILGVNGIRLLGAGSGVARAIEAILACLGELDHPFRTVRVYSPEPISADIRLPAIATNVVVRSRLGPAAWEQFALPREIGTVTAELRTLIAKTHTLLDVERCRAHTDPPVSCCVHRMSRRYSPVVRRS